MTDKKEEATRGPVPIGNTHAIANTDEIYYVIPIPGATYFWTVYGGAITLGQATPQVTIRWGLPRPDGRVQVTTTVPTEPGSSEGITVVIDPDAGHLP